VLDYEITVSTGAQVKNLISSFLPFSTASAHRVISVPRSDSVAFGAKRTSDRVYEYTA
jgi:hypothetical protein